VEIRIGVQYAARELVVESDESPEEVEQRIATAIADTTGVLSLVDHKGKKVLVPSAKIAYIEIGSGTVNAVGFRG
jgi:hypothetical protein